mmetsp:Transcript_27718/g.38549  ORF Transcript_27718/g.38549 Transcript_27718/m.38549 type:complete len:311 (+) Transcript_27718:22-954(+)
MEAASSDHRDSGGQDEADIDEMGDSELKEEVRKLRDINKSLRTQLDSVQGPEETALQTVCNLKKVLCISSENGGANLDVDAKGRLTMAQNFENSHFLLAFLKLQAKVMGWNAVDKTVTQFYRGLHHSSRIELISSERDALDSWGIKVEELLYSGSRDGFRSVNFHEKCDEKQPLLFLFMAGRDSVFGGRTGVEWKKACKPNTQEEHLDDSAFLFTLRNYLSIPPTKVERSGRGREFTSSYSLGPCFGNGELKIVSNCNVSACESKLVASTNKYASSYSYKLPPGLEDKPHLFTGSSSFFISEIEVYKIKE